MNFLQHTTSTTKRAAGAVTALTLLAGIFGAVGAVPASASTPADGDLGPNLVVNGGFEQAALPTGAWTLTTSLPGWSVPPGRPAEVQNHASGSPVEGNQLTEIDGAVSTTLTQSVSVVPGSAYRLHVSYSPRPGYGPEQNAVDVLWNGTRVGQLTADGRGLGDTRWQDFSVTVASGPSASGVLQLRDVGVSDGLGMYLDDVRVQARTCTALPGLVEWGQPTSWSCGAVPGPANPVRLADDSFLSTAGSVLEVLAELRQVELGMSPDQRAERQQMQLLEQQLLQEQANAMRASAQFHFDAAVTQGVAGVAGGIVGGASASKMTILATVKDAAGTEKSLGAELGAQDQAPVKMKPVDMQQPSLQQAARGSAAAQVLAGGFDARTETAFQGALANVLAKSSEADMLRDRASLDRAAQQMQDQLDMKAQSGELLASVRDKLTAMLDMQSVMLRAVTAV